MFKLSNRSKSRLDGVHPHLVEVVKLAIQTTEIDFTVLEGVRSLGRQVELYESGKSKTMNSRHLTGHAVDLAALVENTVSWKPQDYTPIAAAMKAAAKEIGVDIEWGGDWKTFKDYVHWQLPWKEYPSNDETDFLGWG